MKYFRIYGHNVSGNTHVRNIVYREFYHDIVNIANEERHIWIIICFQ
jgi:pectate lyase